MRNLIKALIVVIVFQTILLALGASGVLLLQSVRAGYMELSLSIKNVISFIACFLVTFYLIFGTAGWMIFVTMMIGDK